MNLQETQLWNQISQFELDDEDSNFTFSDRLARENGWTHEFTMRAIDEYKKFMFLISATDKALTPSDEVDQVWHLHLIYTHSYWIEFCGNLLKRQIHHGPTRGGKKEQTKYNDLYQVTLLLYQEKFGYEAPADIWPSPEKRFTSLAFQRVNRDNYWIIKKLFK